jgi:hypothetical protein
VAAAAGGAGLPGAELGGVLPPAIVEAYLVPGGMLEYLGTMTSAQYWRKDKHTNNLHKQRLATQVPTFRLTVPEEHLRSWPQGDMLLATITVHKYISETI